MSRYRIDNLWSLIMMEEKTNSSDNIAETVTDMDALESSVALKRAQREQLNAQIESFLDSGGRISQIAANVLADPPQKPTSNYGSQPI
jgi:hypothetical protein